MRLRFFHLLFLAVLNLNSFGQVYQDSFGQVKKDTIIYERQLFGQEKTYFAHIEPEYQGGNVNFYRFIQSNLTIPKSLGCYMTMIEFQFIVEPDGTLTNKMVIFEDSRVHCDNDGNRDEFIKKMKEIGLNILNKSSKWNPAIFNDEKVAYPVSIPIRIDIQ